MADLGMDQLEVIVRDELEAQAATVPPGTPAGLWRLMAHRARTAGSTTRRMMSRVERKARRVLHEVRKLRAA